MKRAGSIRPPRRSRATSKSSPIGSARCSTLRCPRKPSSRLARGRRVSTALDPAFDRSVRELGRTFVPFERACSVVGLLVEVEGLGAFCDISPMWRRRCRRRLPGRRSSCRLSSADCGPRPRATADSAGRRSSVASSTGSRVRSTADRPGRVPLEAEPVSTVIVLDPSARSVCPTSTVGQVESAGSASPTTRAAREPGGRRRLGHRPDRRAP